MDTKGPKPNNIAGYIRGQPKEHWGRLRDMAEVIRAAAPKARGGD